MKLGEILFVRLDRESTSSYMTYDLPHIMTLDQAERFIEMILPGWEVINGCPENPDDEDFVAWEESTWKSE